MGHGRKIAVIGLGYVGLPVAVAFARAAPVVGFDIDRVRVDELRAGRDRTREVDAADLAQPNLACTSDPAALAGADFYIVTVPTPIDAANRPDLSAMLSASKTVGHALKRGDIVVYESTVYPGAVEDITKVVAALDAKTLDVVAAVYGSAVTAGIHRAPSIKVAEAAKVIENTQRDLNIAFMNELSEICHALGIDTADVLAAARTKWNFLPFHPGLVGGHCIGVDPYYLTHRAERAGYAPRVILAGRQINDGVGRRVARECARLLMQRGGAAPVVTVLGLTFKENVPDIRNSKVVDIVRELSSFGIAAQVHDPLAPAQEAEHQYGIKLATMPALRPADAVVLAVGHEDYVRGGWPLMRKLLKPGGGIVLDVKSLLDRAAKPDEVELWRL